MKARPFGTLRPFWPEYPGERSEQHVSGPKEAQRRIDTWRSLPSSDVALLMANGSRSCSSTYLDCGAAEVGSTAKMVVLHFRDLLVEKFCDVRTDAAGRVIPHEVVVSAPLADQIASAADGLRLVRQQPGVADEFERVRQLPQPPSNKA